MDNADGDWDGSSSPSFSQRTLVRRVACFRRCGAFIPHDVFMASPWLKDYTSTNQLQRFFLPDYGSLVGAADTLPVAVTNRSLGKTARSRSVTDFR